MTYVGAAIENGIPGYFEIRNSDGMIIGNAITNESPFERCQPVTLQDAETNAKLWCAAPGLMNNTERLLEILESLFDQDKSLLSYEDLETYYDIAKSIGRKYRLTEVQNELYFRLHAKRVVFNGLWTNYDKPLFI